MQPSQSSGFPVSRAPGSHTASPQFSIEYKRHALPLSNATLEAVVDECSPRGTIWPPHWSRAGLSQIRYEMRMVAKRPAYLALKAPGGYWVAQSQIEEVWMLFWRHLDHLDVEREHTAESLCNDPSWQDRSPFERRTLGRCLKYLCDHNILPIVLANPQKAFGGSWKYRLLPAHSTPSSAPRSKQSLL